MEPARKDETADSIPLFRNEAIEAATQRFGSPVQAPGVGMWLATGFVVALLGLAVLFLVTTSFPRKETVSGALVPSRGLQYALPTAVMAGRGKSDARVVSWE